MITFGSQQFIQHFHPSRVDRRPNSFDGQFVEFILELFYEVKREFSVSLHDAKVDNLVHKLDWAGPVITKYECGKTGARIMSV